MNLNWRRRLGRNRLLDVGAAAIALMCVGRIVWIVPHRSDQNDFSHYYLSGRLLFEGHNPYTTPLTPLYPDRGFKLRDGTVVANASYPPPFVWLFYVFAALGPQTGFYAWVVVEALCLVWLLWLTRRLLGARLSARGFFFVCAATLMSAAVFWHFFYSQVQLLLAALLLTGYAWHRAGKHTAACLAVATAGLLKIFPFALLPWFVWRAGPDVRTRMRQGLVVLAFVLAVVLSSGIGLWRDFFQRGIPVAGLGLIYRTSNFSLPAFLLSLVNARVIAPSEPHGWLLMLVLMPGLAVIALAYLQCWRGMLDTEAEYCLLVLAMLLGIAVTWTHYLVLLVFPVTVACVRAAARPTFWRLTAIALLLVALNSVLHVSGPFFGRHEYMRTVANHLPLFGMIWLALFLRAP
jgi:hypothetical protein